MPGTIRSLLNGERPIIRSDGTYIRDYIYVKDIARAYITLAEGLGDERVRGEAFNFSTGKPTNVLKIVQIIQKLMDCEDLEPDIRNCAEGEIANQHLSSAKAQKILKWESAYDLESGLQETISWYGDYFRVQQPINR